MPVHTVNSLEQLCVSMVRAHYMHDFVRMGEELGGRVPHSVLHVICSAPVDARHLSRVGVDSGDARAVALLANSHHPMNNIRGFPPTWPVTPVLDTIAQLAKGWAGVRVYVSGWWANAILGCADALLQPDGTRNNLVINVAMAGTPGGYYRRPESANYHHTIFAVVCWCVQELFEHRRVGCTMTTEIVVEDLLLESTIVARRVPFPAVIIRMGATSGINMTGTTNDAPRGHAVCVTDGLVLRCSRGVRRDNTRNWPTRSTFDGVATRAGAWAFDEATPATHINQTSAHRKNAAMMFGTCAYGDGDLLSGKCIVCGCPLARMSAVMLVSDFKTQELDGLNDGTFMCNPQGERLCWAHSRDAATCVEFVSPAGRRVRATVRGTHGMLSFVRPPYAHDSTIDEKRQAVWDNVVARRVQRAAACILYGVPDKTRDDPDHPLLFHFLCDTCATGRSIEYTCDAV